MSAPGSALLLVGSPKRRGSTSQVLGARLVEALARRGWETRAEHLLEEMEERGLETVVHAFWRAQVAILAVPVYVDCLPAHVIAALEAIAERRVGSGGPRLVALVNSGFPEPVHSRLALDICARFCREVGIAWAGGLGLGAGGLVDGRSLDQGPPVLAGVARALDLTADALAAGQEVPAEARQLVARPLVDPEGFRRGATAAFEAAAARLGMQEQLGRRPYPPAP
jgi:hypothetical protein